MPRVDEKKKQRGSPAYKLVAHVWEHRKTKDQESWVVINQVMSEALQLAIKAGLEFFLTDVSAIFADFRGQYWASIENAYTLAVEYDNLPALKALENYLKRKPFILDTGARIHISSDVDWEGQHGSVTSFKDEAGSIIVCTYKSGRKIAKRYTITHPEWETEMKRRKEMRTPPPVNTLVVDKKGREWMVTFSSCRGPGALSLETVERGAGSYSPVDRISSISYPKFRQEGFKVKALPLKLTTGQELVAKDGKAWKVNYTNKNHISLETVERDTSGTFAKDSKRLTYAEFHAAGFQKAPKPTKRTRG